MTRGTFFLKAAIFSAASSACLLAIAWKRGEISLESCALQIGKLQTCLNITICHRIIKSSTIENTIRSYQCYIIHQPSFNTHTKCPKQENTTSSFASGVLFFSRSLRSFSWSVMVSSLGYVDQCCSNP